MGNGAVRAVGFICFSSLTVLIWFASRASISSVSALCEPHDATHVTSRFDCGGFEWELEVTDTAGDDYDEGAYNQSGMCGGGYTDCACSYVEPYTLNAYYQFYPSDNGDGTWNWYWNLYGYNQATYGGCTSGACEGTGETETQNPTVA